MGNMTVAKALVLAKKYYRKDVYNHALRVMQCVAENGMISEDCKDFCLALAICHDLWEDTAISQDSTVYCGDEDFVRAMSIITKKKEMDYVEYIKRIKIIVNDAGIIGQCVWWVKLADMRDHLEQRETLTENLKEKYLTALPYLL